MDEKFSRWFLENSGYSLHKTPKRKFSTSLCCGEAPTPTGKRALFPHPISGAMEPMALHRCARCGKHYICWEGKYCPVENLLKLQILPE